MKPTILLAAVALAACAPSVTPAERAAIKLGADTALKLGTYYKRLPTCGPNVSPLCSTPATWAKVNLDGERLIAAQASLDTSSASGAPAALSAVQAALAAMTADVPVVK